MRNKKVIIGIVLLVAFIALILIIKAAISKTGGKQKTAAAATAKKTLGKAQAAKIISKGKGALTVKMLNSKNVEVPLKYKAFKVVDNKSSIYMASSVGGRMQELMPGTYDIEIDTVPQKIAKNIKVSEGKETIENLGCVSGSLTVRTLTAKKTAASYPIRILYPNGGDMITAYISNRSIEVVPGSYDVEIGIAPRIYKKDIKVDAGKETVMDLGCVTGTLLVKVVDENMKNVRASVRIINAASNEVVSSGTSNKPMELGKGVYNVDVLTTPKQGKKDVKVNIAEDTVIEFVEKAPAAAKPAAAKSKK